MLNLYQVAKLSCKTPFHVFLGRTYPPGSIGLSWAAQCGVERWWTLGKEEKEESGLGRPREQSEI